MDTPEVYSRERLVNDRFQQDAWLREKLRENPTQGIQGSFGTSSQTSTTFALGAGTKPQTPPKEQLEKAGTQEEIQDTPIEQFRDVMAYREEVRNEILENQLDDRHDIAGNTLYRLKFDATVLPLQDTSAYAMVEVTITGPSVWNISEDDEKGKALSDLQLTEKGLDEPTAMLLEESEYARYVAGLDRETFELYRRVYKGWLRDIDPDNYSEEDIFFGQLQGYLDYDERKDPPVFERQTSVLWFTSKTERDAVARELVAHGVPSEYLMLGGDNTGDSFLRVKTGLANFIADLRDHDAAIFTYAVTPKERTQRVYGNTLAAGSSGISIGAEKRELGASLAHSNAREARANAIMRQPQVVGYSPEAHRSGEATMGWLIGPRYKISGDPNGLVSFRHVPSQHALTGIVSVPSWWDELNLVTRTYWLDENGVEYTKEGMKMVPGQDAGIVNVSTVALPSDLTSILEVLDPKRREPRIAESSARPEEFRACEPGSVIIRGSQLWRSTVVTLGSQQADSISVLPNMEGVIATFNAVKPSTSGTESLYLWTSEGEEFVRPVSIRGECQNSPAS